jgi:uncharacterized membrane protein
MILNIRMASFRKRLKLLISAMIGLLFAFELETIVSGFKTTLSTSPINSLWQVLVVQTLKVKIF